MAIVGLGIGVCLPNMLVMVQNAAERQDVGTATGAMLFLRSMGGAFGSTLVGALLTCISPASWSRPATRRDDLGRASGGALAALGAGSAGGRGSALSSGFRLAFAACGSCSWSPW